MIWGRWIFAAGILVWTFSASASSAEGGLEGEVKVSSNIRPSDLVVYLVNPPPAPKFSRPRTATVDQRHQAFHPHVLAILKGTTVTFLNSDRVAHNVFSLSPAKPFDLGKIAPNTFGQMSFEKPGVVEVLCGFHSRMLAYIRVMEHPYFAIPDAQGGFIIQDVPPGTYQLRIWHESLGEISKEIRLPTDRSAPIQLYFPK